MSLKIIKIFLVVSILSLLFPFYLSAQYYGFEKKSSFYKLKNSQKDDAPFKKIFPGYKIIQPELSVIDSSKITIPNTRIYKLAPKSHANIGAFKSELICENYFKSPYKKISLRSPVISNADYHQFVRWVIDSIAHELLGQADDPWVLGEHYITDKIGDPINYGNKNDTFYRINWKEDIEWNKSYIQYILEDPNGGIFLPEQERLNKIKSIDPRVLNFDNYRFCFNSVLNPPKNYLKLLRVQDSCGYTLIWCLENVSPDTIFWVINSEHINLNFRIALSKYYNNHDYFKSYPIMGMSIYSIEAFLAYKAIQHNQLIKNNNPKLSPKQIPEIVYRLPDASEINDIKPEKIRIKLDTNLLYRNFQITEYEYFVFMKHVADSIIRYQLAEYGYDNKDSKLVNYYKCDKFNDVIEYGDHMPYYLLNWERAIKWDKEWKDLNTKQILCKLKIFDSINETIISDNILYKYQDILWAKIIYDPDEYELKSLRDLSVFFGDSVINIFPNNELGKFFKENYGKKSFNKISLRKFKENTIKGISYEQAYAFYIWRNQNLVPPKNSNPLNYFTIPTKEQWEKVSNYQAIDLPSEIILSNPCDRMDKNRTTQEFPFRIVMDAFFIGE